MADTYWLDYSADKLDGQVIKRAGYAGVIRYIDSPANLGWKHTTKAEYASHRAAGLGIRMVMQTNTTASAGGFPTGVAHARRAKAGADYLGYRGVIYFTNDRTTLPNPREWQSYLRGAVSVLGRANVGAYGFGNAMDAARGIVDHFWQAGRRSEVRPFVQIWQDNNTQVTVGGITCDRNLILKPLTELEDDMQLTDKADWDKINALGPAYVGHKLLGTWQNAGTAARNSNVIVGMLKALQTGLSEAEARIVGAVQADNDGTVDVPALAEALVEELGPDLGEQLIAAIGRALSNPNTEEEN